MPNSIFVGELVLVKPLKDKEDTEKKIREWCATLQPAQ